MVGKQVERVTDGENNYAFYRLVGHTNVKCMNMTVIKDGLVGWVGGVVGKGF